jgi:hypothetical protein
VSEHPTSRQGLQKALVGPAGEHFVLFRLYQQGLLASLSPPGAPTVDILVLSPDERVVANIQVKTRTDKTVTGTGQPGWLLSEKDEKFARPRYFYALVDLEQTAPVTYIVPSRIIADVLRKAHDIWIKTPGRGGQQRKASSMRRVLWDYGFEVPGYPPGWLDRYKEYWDLITTIVEGQQ